MDLVMGQLQTGNIRFTEPEVSLWSDSRKYLSEASKLLKLTRDREVMIERIIIKTNVLRNNLIYLLTSQVSFWLPWFQNRVARFDQSILSLHYIVQLFCFIFLHPLAV